MPFLAGPPRSAVRAVKAAEFAFTGAERTALTEEAGGGVQSLAGRAGKRKTTRTEINDLSYGFLLDR